MTGQILTNPREIEVDVLVIGGGGTGLSAAIAAADEGAKVLVTEKNSFFRGSTAICIGSITASNTSYQAREGIHDSPENFFEDMTKFNAEFDPYDDHELRWILAHEAGKTIEWLRGFGFEFFGPSPEPPHRVPRMHNVIPSAWSYPVLLLRAAGKRGVRVFLDTPAFQVLDTEGKVIPGLFAGGENVGNLVRRGHGMGLAWAFTSGRLAGKEAAQSA